MAKREETINRIHPLLDKLLRDQGFQTSSELEQRLMQLIHGKELEDYKRIKTELDVRDTAMGILWDIIGLVGVGAGVVVGVGYAFSVVAAAEALAAIGTVGGFIGIAAITVLVFGGIEGAEERRKLRDEIHKLWPIREEMKVEVERMRAITKWADYIETWLQYPEIDSKNLNNMLAKSLYRDYKQWTPNEAGRVLKDLDHARQSWTNEDHSETPLPPFIEEVPNGSRIAPAGEIRHVYEKLYVPEDLVA